MGRLGIDLSGDSVILASVNPKASRIELRDFERLDTNPDLLGLAEDLRRARRQHRFPRRTEVVAWPGDPRVNAVRDAGFTVERVIMPGEALERVARMHHALSGIPGVTAVLSVDSSGGALAIVRDGAVLQETALTWSRQGATDAADSDLLRRYSFLSELTETLGASFAAVQRSANARVSDILTCGSLPDLRSLTMPLADEFDVEVETLDSMSEIDVKVKGRMPEEIADALPTLWVAMVASRRWHQSRRPVRKLLKIAVPAGLAAGLVMMVVGGRTGGSTSSSVARTPVVAVPRPAPAQSARVQPIPQTPASAVPAPVRPVTPAPLTLAPVASAAVAPAPVTAAPVTAATATPAPATPVPVGSVLAASASAPHAPASAVRVEPRPAPASLEAPKIEPQRTEPARVIPPARERQRAAAEAASQLVSQPRALSVRPAETPQRAVPAQQTPQLAYSRPNLSNLLPISLPLTSILWSPERQLVVFADGQTLEVGDSISGLRIVRIEQDSVVVRDKSGRLRRAALRQGPESMP